MRIFVDRIDGDKCVLKGDAHRHVAYALRSRVGDAAVLCLQNGKDYFGVIESISSDETVVKINEITDSMGEPRVKVTVMCAVPGKSDKLDLIAQKLTELGVFRIQPIMTRFVQAKPQSVRVDRLSRICEEAAKQCGRGLVPEVCAPVSFERMTAELPRFDLTVFPYEREKEYSLKSYLKNADLNNVETVAVIIGSEGGFSEEEANILRNSGTASVTLGNRILRTETANIAVVSALMYELGEWGDGGLE